MSESDDVAQNLSTKLDPSKLSLVHCKHSQELNSNTKQQQQSVRYRQYDMDSTVDLPDQAKALDLSNIRFQLM